MTKSNIVSLVLIIGYPVLNVGAVIAIVAINNWFLLEAVYPLVFGVAAPLAVLIPFWCVVVMVRESATWFILPCVATLVVILCGGFHFFITAIAAASV